MEERKSSKQSSREVVGWSAEEIAELMKQDLEGNLYLFSSLPLNRSVELFLKLGLTEKKEVLETLNEKLLKKIFSRMAPDDTITLVEDLPPEFSEKVLSLLPSQKKKVAVELLGYPEESVGRWMTPDYVALKPEWKVRQAIAHIRRHGKKAETVNVLYVVDDEGKLIDELGLEDLVFSNPRKKIKSLMDGKFVSVSAFDDQEVAVEKIKTYDLLALPVVDELGILKGIVTVDDLIDVLERETTEDVQLSGSIGPLGKAYLDTSITELFKKRVGWLTALGFLGFISLNIISFFEGVISAVVALTFFIPVLIGSAGNTGTQTTTLVTRSIAVGELSTSDWKHILKKEAIIGIMEGLTLGVLLFMGGIAIGIDPEVNLVASISIFTLVLLANLIGSTLPIVLTWMNLDSAVVSSPLITTLVDTLGIFLYFLIAMWWFGLY